MKSYWAIVKLTFRNALRSHIFQLLLLLLLLAVIVGAIGIVFHQGILGLMNTPSAAWEEAVGYLVICSCGMIFIYGYNALCAILRGMGESKLPMVFIAADVLSGDLFCCECGAGSGICGHLSLGCFRSRCGDGDCPGRGVLLCGGISVST